MGRPSLPVGEYGEISYNVEHPGTVRARCRYRDLDGRTRPLSRSAKTKTAARQRLIAAVRERTGYVPSALSPDSYMRDLTDRWVAMVQSSPDYAIGTKESWERVARKKVKPNIGALRLRELTVPLLDTAIGAVRDRDGRGAARTYKGVLSSIFAYAVRQGVLSDNPVSHTSRLTRGKDEPANDPVALTVEQTADLLSRLDSDRVACEQGITDIVRFMLGTGVRIGEALSARWRYVSLLDSNGDTAGRERAPVAGTFTVVSTTTQQRGHGTIIQEHPKSKAGHRTLVLPRQVVDMLAGRQELIFPELETDLVFPNQLGHLWSRDKVSTALREALDRAGYPWVTSHCFRKTVLTRLDDMGVSTRLVSVYAGHKSAAFTQDRYMGRNVVVSQGADLLPD